MARHHQHYTRRPKPSIIPAPLVDGKVRCPGCSRVVTPTPNGRLRAHNAPSGEPCAMRTVVAAEPIRIEELPPVVFYERSKPPTPPTPKPTPAKAKSYGECRECGKWLPGERRLCGACSVSRGLA